MADTNNFDRESIDLFCDEGAKALCFDDDDWSVNDQNYQTSVDKRASFIIGESDFEASDVSLPCLSDECIDWMVKREKERMPRYDYVERLSNGELDLTLRKDSLHWMIGACARYDFGDLCLYSAMSYFDRFLSVHEFSVSSQQQNDKSWATQLAALACLSLAAKMQETKVPFLMDLQGSEPKSLFEGKIIRRMETFILNRLNWEMKAYTPFNYIDFYLRKMNDGEFPPQPVISESTRIILSTLEDIKFLEYKPSEIAAAVAIYVSKMDVDKTPSGFICVEKGRVLKCLELIREFLSARGTDSATTTENVANASAATIMIPYSPNGVLDFSCFSFKIDERTSVESCPSSSPENKRRKRNNNSSRWWW